MTISHENAARSALADLMTSREGTGAGANATLTFRAGTADVVTFNLNDPTFGSAVNGTRTMAGAPITQAAAAAGVVDNFQVKNKGGSLEWSGSITAIGGGGDIEITNVNIANGQDVQLASLTYTASS